MEGPLALESMVDDVSGDTLSANDSSVDPPAEDALLEGRSHVIESD